MIKRSHASVDISCSQCCWASLRIGSPTEAAQPSSPTIRATRLPQNPLITVKSSPTLGDNVNGPTIIRVPSWVDHPLGRYYMYFAHHMGTHIRLAYADAIAGPWHVYDPGVLEVKDTAFYRPQPDPPENLENFYTHVASPEIFVDDANKRLVMWFHGWWTDGAMWPVGERRAQAWAREHGYAQDTQSAESNDGLHFTVKPAISKTSYLRVFQHDGYFYGMARLGLLLRSRDPFASFEVGQKRVPRRRVREARAARRSPAERIHALRIFHGHRRCAGARDAFDRRLERRLADMAGVRTH